MANQLPDADETAPRRKRRLRAALAADIANFSGRVSVNETRAFGNLSSILKVGREELERHEGDLIGMPGDGLFALFESAVDAMQCAIAIQKRLSEEHNLGGMRLRIGIHVGDVLFEGDLPFGETLNIASRLESLADPGGILVSGTMVDLVSARISATFEDRGVPKLKNIPRRITTFAVHPADLSATQGADVPSRPLLDKTMQIPRKDQPAPKAPSLQERLAEAKHMEPDSEKPETEPPVAPETKHETTLPADEPPVADLQPTASGETDLDETRAPDFGSAVEPETDPGPSTLADESDLEKTRAPYFGSAIEPAPPAPPTDQPSVPSDPIDLDATRAPEYGSAAEQASEPPPQAPLNDAAHTPEDIAQIVDALAVNMGPVARVMVNRKAKSIPTTGALIEELLGELKTSEERAAFRSKLLNLIGR